MAADNVVLIRASKGALIFLSNQLDYKITIRLPIAEYGWIQRYAEKNDMPVSQVMRKALKFYIAAIEQKKKKEQETKANE